MSRRKARDLGEAEAAAAATATVLDDARALAVEISRGAPSSHIDAMSAGVVLLPGEIAYRWVGVWLVVQDLGLWAVPSWTRILITDRRLLCRCEDGRLLSLRWSELTGLQVCLEQQRVSLNYGDRSPIALVGADAVVLAVAAVAGAYGWASLLTHPALSVLRSQ